MVLNGLKIEFHAELTNKLFVQGHHILQTITLKVFVIQNKLLVAI